MEHKSVILIVDDEQIVCDAIAVMLEGLGYDLAFARSGEEALAKAAEITPDLILLDVIMPGMDGFEVCRRLRADPLLSEVPVIIVTVLGDRDSRLQGIAVGADDFVTKPFDRVELQARIQTITRLNRYRQLLQANRQLESKIAQLSALYDISSALNSISDLDVLLESIIQKTVETLNAEGASVVLWDQQQDRLYFPVVASEEGEVERRLRRIYLPTNAGIAGWVFREGKPALVPDVNADERFYREADRHTEFVTKSVLCVPLRVEGRIIGAIEAVNKKEGMFTEDDLQLLEAMADNVAVSIERANLHQDLKEAESLLRRQNAELKQALEALETEMARRQQLEEQLRQSQKMEAIGQLAGDVAHDFGNLLQVIMGYSEPSLTSVFNRDMLCECIEKIRKAGERAATLTRQLLAFSRKQTLQMQVISLNSPVADMGKVLKRFIRENIELVTELSPEIMPVRADPGQIEQVIMNLVINARDAMPEGGRLTIRTENVVLDEEQCKSLPESRPGRFVCLSVSDTGTGMSKEILQRVFEPFFTTKEPGKGTGLGLSIVYGIVKQHDGWINVYSEPGKGATFKVYIPIVSEKPEEKAEEKIPLEEFSGRGERILVVEDEPAVLEYNAEVLREMGYTVFEAEDAEEAIDIFEKENGNFDLIFADVVLHGKSGLQLADQLLSVKPDLRVLLCSGYTDYKMHWQIVREREFQFLQKPYSLVDLLRSVRETIERK